MIRALLLIVALGAAFGAGWLYMEPQPGAVDTASAPVVAASSQAALTAIPAPATLAGDRTVRVLGATAELQPGQTVTEGDLGWIDWPAALTMSHQIQQADNPDAIQRLVGQMAMLAAAVGEPVRGDGFAPLPARPISERLAPGMRAVAVRVNLEAAVGGFVLPNDRVDVIHTDTTGNGIARSTIVVFNARVIAIDQITQQGNDATIMVSRTVTLELDRAGAEAVASAQTTGQLTLALRATADIAEPSTVPPSISQTLAPGMRAVVLREVELTPGGAVRAGDRIDLIHSRTAEGAAQPVNTIIASNVRVIALDDADDTLGTGQARQVTLELDSTGVNALAAARGTGTLSLSLRAAADVNEAPEVQFPLVPAPPAIEPEVRVRRGGEP